MSPDQQFGSPVEPADDRVAAQIDSPSWKRLLQKSSRNSCCDTSDVADPYEQADIAYRQDLELDGLQCAALAREVGLPTGWAGSPRREASVPAIRPTAVRRIKRLASGAFQP